MRRHPSRIVISQDGSVEMRRRLKRIESCPVCKKRRYLEEVTCPDGLVWREEVHSSHYAAGKCEAIMFPPWEGDRWEPTWKKVWREIRWKWSEEWKPLLASLVRKG